MLRISDRKKNYKDDTPTTVPSPERLYIPITGYRGEMVPLVSTGEYVSKYQVLAQSEGVFAGRVHAPVSGVIGDMLSIDNANYLELINDFTKKVLEPKIPDTENITVETFANHLLEYGIEGSGGARFPTSLKYKVGSRVIDTLVLNGAECEPHLTADYAVMKHHSRELARATALVQQVVKVKEVVIGIEYQHRSLKPLIEEAFMAHQVKGRVALLHNSYPQGGELQLIKAATRKTLSKGSIPADYGVIVSNVGTMWAIYRAFYEGKPYTKRLVTVYDAREKRGITAYVPIGTPIEQVLSHAGIAVSSGSEDTILGGPMMGMAVTDKRRPIHKGSGGVIIAPKRTSKSANCIGCGYCTDVCPQRLLPLEFARGIAENLPERLTRYNLADCIECGSCAYVCPADVPLMRSIKEGKKLLISQAI